MTKGAFAMVLAGAVTFSVANALLAEQPLKRLTKEIAFPISADREKAIVVNQPEKKDPTPTTNVKDHDIAATQVALKNSHPATIAVQANTKKLSTTNKAPAVTPVATTVSVKNTKAPTTTTTSTKPRTATISTTTKPRTNTTSASTKPATTTKPATSTKPATTTKPVTSTKPVTTTKPVTSTKPTTPTTSAAKPSSKPTTAATTKTNRGQQVSQAAKERAASRKATKENNGNKM